MEQLGSHSTDLKKKLIFSILGKSVEKIQVPVILTRITGTIHEDLYIVMIACR